MYLKCHKSVSIFCFEIHYEKKTKWIELKWWFMVIDEQLVTDSVMLRLYTNLSRTKSKAFRFSWKKLQPNKLCWMKWTKGEKNELVWSFEYFAPIKYTTVNQTPLFEVEINQVANKCNGFRHESIVRVVVTLNCDRFHAQTLKKYRTERAR